MVGNPQVRTSPASTHRRRHQLPGHVRPCSVRGARLLHHVESIHGFVVAQMCAVAASQLELHRDAQLGVQERGARLVYRHHAVFDDKCWKACHHAATIEQLVRDVMQRRAAQGALNDPALRMSDQQAAGWCKETCAADCSRARHSSNDRLRAAHTADPRSTPHE